MAENNSVVQDDSTAAHMLKKVYLKDLSFESPNTPGIFSGDGEQDPRHKMQITISVWHDRLENHEYEVTVRLTLHATDAGDKTFCLVEVEQAGIFIIKDDSEENLLPLLKVHCPRVLYPFARQTVWSIVNSGGFPTLLLQDFDFDAMQQMQSASA